MIFAPLRYLFTGIVIGMVIVGLSNDYVIISRRKYDRLRKKERKDQDE